MVYFFGLLYIAAYIAIYLMVLLLPYYVAYSLIQPNSFLGVVGVFILGSFIVPLTLGFASLVFGSFFIAFEKFKEKIAQKHQSQPLSPYRSESSASSDITPLDGNPLPENTKAKDSVFFTIIGLSAIGVVLFLIVNNEINKMEAASYNYNETYYEDTEAASESSPSDDIYTDVVEQGEQESYVVNNITDNYNFMSQAVDKLLNTLSDSGIIGVAKNVRDCYVSADVDKLYCLYLDKSARILDEAMSKELGINRNEYLNDNKVLERNQKYYYIPNNTSHLEADHQRSVESQLISLLNSKLEQKYKSQNESVTSTTNTATESYENSLGTRLGVEMSQGFNNANDLTDQTESELVSNDSNNELEINDE